MPANEFFDVDSFARGDFTLKDRPIRNRSIQLIKNLNISEQKQRKVFKRIKDAEGYYLR